jgi:hypothetical protein
MTAQLLVVHVKTFPDHAQLGSQLCIIRPPAVVTHRCPIYPKCRTRLPFADFKRHTNLSDGLSLSPFFDLLEYRIVEHGVRQKLLQLAVLVLKRPQPLASETSRPPFAQVMTIMAPAQLLLTAQLEEWSRFGRFQ